MKQKGRKKERERKRERKGELKTERYFNLKRTNNINRVIMNTETKI